MTRAMRYASVDAISPVPASMNPKPIQHPINLPIFRWRPARVSGMPIVRESRAFAAEMPTARFHENDKPGIRKPLPAMWKFRRAAFIERLHG